MKEVLLTQVSIQITPGLFKMPYSQMTINNVGQTLFMLMEHARTTSGIKCSISLQTLLFRLTYRQ